MEHGGIVADDAEVVGMVGVGMTLVVEYAACVEVGVEPTDYRKSN